MTDLGLIDIRIKVKIAFNKVLKLFIFKHYVSRIKDMLQYLDQEIENSQDLCSVDSKSRKGDDIDNLATPVVLECPKRQYPEFCKK